ncbi:MAG: HAD family phosphatase [Dehalococcoidia bacterium]|nr:HAD family phosphatase [Dehalococcoidia bacterium]MDZ4247528.1 HAD family phosphatase [Dehalococcoidia bacterium]
MNFNDQKVAVIWDMDGVIADTAQLHFRAWRSVFLGHNVGFIYQDFRHSFGQRNDTIIKNILGPKVNSDLINSIAGEKEKRFLDFIEEDLQALPGAVGLIKALHRSGCPLALGSSAPLANIEFILKKLKLKKYFPVITSNEDVLQGKPDPQVFLLAATRLNVEPSGCLVIEDAVAGVEAARNAGMKCIAVTNTHGPEHLKEADLVVDSLASVTAETIFNILNTGGSKTSGPN